MTTTDLAPSTQSPATPPGRRPQQAGRRRHREPLYRRKGSGDFTKPSLPGLVTRYGLLAFVTVIVVGPLVWQLSTSFKGPLDDIYSFPPAIVPTDPTAENYVRVTDFIPVYRYAWHSLLVSVATVLSNVVLSVFAGYALGAMRFRGKIVVMGVLLSTMLLPGEVTVTSNFLTIRNLGLADSLVGVYLPGAIGAMNVLLIATACRMIPHEVLDAAIVDGATTWQRIRHIVWPNVKGMASVVAIFAFIGAWDDFLWPLIVLNDPSKYTLTVGMAYLNGNFQADPRLIAAGTMIALVPIVVLFSSLQRFFFRGVAEGAVKG
ncbi:carbohydrate ABC transporter permease [Isoptericola sp. BMS4]|uniref:carbohydrate ABC transporter permease n=1 Tax=Isoptericola sp. BMS4 TaxID=2527875 RepID=UPI001423DC0A|nr:carbohydrate ABC transporter permease [Isoptericola sp. BMS4]